MAGRRFYQKYDAMPTKLSIFLCLLFTACAAPSASDFESPRSTDDRSVQVVRNPLDLADMLVRVPGITVQGNRVLLRGREPLFVVDGLPVGSYYSAQTAVDVNDVAEIEVLKTASETARYGRRGGNGVILIRTVGNEEVRER